MSYSLKDLDYSLKDEISRIKESSGNISAATSFLSMYMWRNVYGDKIVCQDGFYSLKLKGEENTWFFPTGNREAKVSFIEEKLKDGNLKLVFATDDDVEFLNEFFEGKFSSEEAFDSSEYLYDANAYRTLDGSLFRKIRYEIKKTEKDYSIEWSKLDKEGFLYINEILSDWIEESDIKGDFSVRRNGFDISILAEPEKNDIRGIVVKCSGKPIAAMTGIVIGDTFDVFFAEHKKGYDGLLTYCMNKIVYIFDSKIEYINMEEDLGIEGLRIWKNKMRPANMINMWECYQA